MNGDMSEGAKIAIVLIILGVLISIVFTVLSFTRNATQQGLSSVEGSMNQMLLARFDNYDQVLKSGTETLAALKLFESDRVGIVIRTAAQMATTANTGHNYGARLVGTNETTNVTAPLTKPANASWYEVNLWTSAGGTFAYNLNTVPTTSTGTPPYIRPTAKFLAELIKDETGSIVGICFTQQ
jgi:hypothetical protein